MPKLKCINCNSSNTEIIGDKLSESGEMYDVDVYKCNDCECEFDEEES